MNGYLFDENGFFTGLCDCQVDQASTDLAGETVYFLPENATLTAPTEFQASETAQFIAGEWFIVPDYRGQNAYFGAELVIISEPGELLPGYSLEPTPEYIAEQARQAFKAQRAEIVDNLVVQVDGFNFNADEKSHARMLNAISSAEFLGSPVIPFWVMSDNVIAENLPIATMKQAHADAIIAMAAVWVPAQ